ncbi:MAG: hypothetical protein IK027_04745 [Deltaproteobacteria bacterium]|nr:hypothetical protein [Deltaproteobacteria bacterium]
MKQFIMALGDVFNVAPRPRLSSREKLFELYAENEKRTVESDLRQHFASVGRHILNACKRYASERVNG